MLAELAGDENLCGPMDRQRKSCWPNWPATEFSLAQRTDCENHVGRTHPSPLPPSGPSNQSKGSRSHRSSPIRFGHPLPNQPSESGNLAPLHPGLAAAYEPPQCSRNHSTPWQVNPDNRGKAHETITARGGGKSHTPDSTLLRRGSPVRLDITQFNLRAWHDGVRLSGLT